MELDPNPKGGLKHLSNGHSRHDQNRHVQKMINWAHRGASGHRRENTIVAFRLAVEMGADGIECDIRETRDGHLVIFHDATLKRIFNQSRAIAASSLAYLQKMGMQKGGALCQEEEGIPELSQLFKTIKPPCRLNLEIKKATPAILLDQIYRHHVQERVLLSSFDGAVLSQIRSLDSKIAIGYLIDKEVTTEKVETAKKMNARSVHLDMKYVKQVEVERLHGNEFEIYSYTVNDLESMAQLIKMGVDGLFTNYPDRLTRLLCPS